MVALGATVVEPVAAIDVKAPGLMLTLVAPLVFHARVVFVPALTLDGFAVKELMAATPEAVALGFLVVPAQLASAIVTKKRESEANGRPRSALTRRMPGCNKMIREIGLWADIRQGFSLQRAVQRLLLFAGTE